MGVPKFFRWLSERYPLISRPVSEFAPPEFDNLYLDMNGIIHACTHSNDTKLNAALSMKEICLKVFQYIDMLFQIVRPRRLFYLAVDGVAPRAKMNQQRQRRFRSAKEAKEAMEQAKGRGQEVPASLFDSNCITPGTEFMAELSKHLKFFIRKKLNEDSLWRRVQVIFSGHEVPGEGEHKIMEYIRHLKGQPDYDPNQSHCLYGLDADLIMLSLASHEPHFALLREEVVFGRPSKKKLKEKADKPPDFQLLYVSLLREYMDREFRSLAPSLPFGYDLERVVDDFILMCFFVGNDFLPHLPSMDIADGALDKMLEIYKELLPQLGGYLTDAGDINFDRLEPFLVRLAAYEREVYKMQPLHFEVLENNMRLLGAAADEDDEVAVNDDDDDDDLADLDNLRFVQLMGKEPEEFGLEDAYDHHRSHHRPPPTTAARYAPRTAPPHALAAADDDELILLQPAAAAPVLVGDSDGTGRGEDDEQAWRDLYYMDKFQMRLSHTEFHRGLRRAYMEGLVWVLQYYYRGCPSWGWFYPYHYAPLASDLVQVRTYLGDGAVRFELGQPYLPYQQLLGVLPPESKWCLPPPYQELMTSGASPLRPFFPSDVRLDPNGKKNPWEAVVLLPFIDQRLLELSTSAIDPARLSPDERARNAHGVPYRFRSDPRLDETYPSSMPGTFPPIAHCRVAVEEFHLPPLRPLRAGTSFVLLPATKTGIDNPPGFPTLAALQDYRVELKRVGANLFGNSSKKESLIIRLPAACRDDERRAKLRARNAHRMLARAAGEEAKEREEEEEEAAEPATAEEGSELLAAGRCYVEWPYLKEAQVVGVSTARERVVRTGSGLQRMPQDGNAWAKTVQWLQGRYLVRRGIELGPIGVLLHVHVLEGVVPQPDGSVAKWFSAREDVYPLQLVLSPEQAARRRDPRNDEAGPLPVDRLFPVGLDVVFIGGRKHYGAVGTVIGHVPHTGQLRVLLEEPCGEEPNFGQRIAAAVKERYYPLYVAAKRLGVSSGLLSKITGSLYVDPAPHAGTAPAGVNIGLNLKFTSKGQRVLGYARKVERAVPGGPVVTTVAHCPAPALTGTNAGAPPGLLGSAPSDSAIAGAGYWELSDKAVELVAEYKRRFPQLFAALEVLAGGGKSVRVDQLFPEGDGDVRLKEITGWLAAQEPARLPRVPCSFYALPADAIAQIDKEAASYRAAHPPSGRRFTRTVAASQLLKPVAAGALRLAAAVPRHPLSLGDRVINLRNNGPVPFGLHGTVVEIEGGGTTAATVVFDEEFIGGTNLDGRCSDMRGLAHIPVECLLRVAVLPPARTDKPPAAAVPRREPYRQPSPPSAPSPAVRVLARQDGAEQQQPPAAGVPVPVPGSFPTPLPLHPMFLGSPVPFTAPVAGLPFLAPAAYPPHAPVAVVSSAPAPSGPASVLPLAGPPSVAPAEPEPPAVSGGEPLNWQQQQSLAHGTDRQTLKRSRGSHNGGTPPYPHERGGAPHHQRRDKGRPPKEPHHQRPRRTSGDGSSVSSPPAHRNKPYKRSNRHPQSTAAAASQPPADNLSHLTWQQRQLLGLQ